MTVPRSGVRVGPLRCGLSRSGMVVSVLGIRLPARVAGPCGAVVRVGADGTHTYLTEVSARPAPPGVPPFVGNDRAPGRGEAALRPAHPDDLVESLNAAARRRWYWPWVLAVAVLLAVLVSPWTLPVGVPAVVAVAWRDRVRRVVVAFHLLDDPSATAHAELLHACAAVVGAQRAWRRTGRSALETTHERKVHSGASWLVDRVDLERTLTGPRHLASDVVVPTLRAGAWSIHLLPDRALVHDGARYRAAGYGELRAGADTNRFVEDRTVPSDAAVVGETWREVNVDGGPDRRFRDNRRVPIVEYGEVTLGTGPGAGTILTFSRPGVAQRFAAAVEALRAALPTSGAPRPRDAPGPAADRPSTTSGSATSRAAAASGPPDVTLAGERPCAVTGTQRHQDRLRALLDGSTGPVRVVAELGWCAVTPGRDAVEVRIGGARVGQLGAAASGRYADLVRAVERDGRVPTAEATLTDVPGGVRVELSLPR